MGPALFWAQNFFLPLRHNPRIYCRCGSFRIRAFAEARSDAASPSPLAASVPVALRDADRIIHYRLRVSGYELPEVGRTAQHAYDDRFAAVLGALPHTPSAAFRLGGAQSLHTNSRDEALGLPAEESARIALRTQRIIAYETRVTNTTDPVGGSEYIENLTDEIEDGVIRILDEIEKMGGTLSAIETRWVQQQIQNAAYNHQRAVESGTQVVVDRLEGKSSPGWEIASTL